MDVVGVVAIISDNEGLREQHGLVVVNLQVTVSHLFQYLNLSSASDQNSIISGGLDIHGLDVMAEVSTETLAK